MRRRRYTSISEINVTNLVDVTMVLLIIFMITAPLLRSGIEVNLPQTKADNITTRDNVTVTVNREGLIFLNDEKISISSFQPALLKKYEASGKKTVLLMADKTVPYGRVIEVMDRIKKVGINNVGLVVEPIEKK